MAFRLFTNFPPQFLDANGDPLASGTVEFKLAGTSTDAAIYSDEGGTAATNPQVLDAEGRFATGIWGDESVTYKVTVKNSSGTTIGAVIDNVRVGSGLTGSAQLNQTVENQLGSAASSNVFTLTNAYSLGVNNLYVYRNGQKLINTVDYTETDANTVTIDSGITINSGDRFQFIVNTSSSTSATLASAVTYTPAGTGAVATNVQDRLREVVSVTDFGAVGDGTQFAGTGTDDSAAIQLAFDYIRDNGGTLEFDAKKVYRCDSALTLLANSSSVKDLPYVVNGNGCFLDFSNITGSTVALKVGATALANLNENSPRRFGGFTLTGPESTASTTPSTTTEGLRVEYGHNTHFHDIYISSFYKACHKYFTFRDYWTNVRCRNSFIGFWLDSANTQAQYNECSVDQSAHPMVFQPNTDSNGVGSQTFVNLKILNNRGPITLDPGTQGTGNDHRISNISFITPRWEGNGEDKTNGDYTDIFRIGFAWDSDPTAVGSARDRWIMNTSIINPTFRHSFNVPVAWQSGNSYAANVTLSNTSSEVLKVTTAGGGASTVEPTSANAGTTLADGYVWSDQHDNGRPNKFIRATTNKKVIGVICEGCAIDWEQDIEGTMRHIKFTGATQINRQKATTTEVNGVMRFQQWNSDEGRIAFDYVGGSEKYTAGNFDSVSGRPGQEFGDDLWSTGSVATNSTRRYAGKLYLAINSGTAATGSEPVHVSSEATGADGITWRYLGRDYLEYGQTTITYLEHLHTAYWKSVITGNSDKGPIHVSNDNGHAKVSRCFITALECQPAFTYDGTNSYGLVNTFNYRPLFGYCDTAAWVTGTAYTAGQYVKAATSDQYVYKCLTAGGGNSTNEPTHTTRAGVTEADGYTWAYWRRTEPADWASGTYVAGDRVRGADKWYEVVTAGGGSSSNEPTHTDTSTGTTEADGYTWRYLGTFYNLYDNLRAWNDSHATVVGELRTNSNKVYRALNAGSAGATPPTHTEGVKSDGTIEWLYEGATKSESDALCRIDWNGHIGIEATS